MTIADSRPYAFVLLPSGGKRDEVYQDAIRAACEAAGLHFERGDRQACEGKYASRICNHIANAKLIIADITGLAPNVYYAVGFAHALDKETILLVHSVEDIPHDLVHCPCIVYNERVSDLKTELGTRIARLPSRAECISAHKEPLIRCYIGRTEIAGSPILECPADKRMLGLIRLQLNVHNSVDSVNTPTRFRCGVVSSSACHLSVVYVRSISDRKPYRSFVQDSGDVLHIIDDDFLLLPGAWERINLVFSVQPQADPIQGTSVSMNIRVYNMSGARDFPFTLRVTHEQPTIGSSVFLTRGTPLAGQETRQGSESAEP